MSAPRPKMSLSSYLIVAGLALGGMVLIGVGLWGTSDTSQVAAPLEGGFAPGAPPSGMVTPGAGITTHAAPADTTSTERDALCAGCDVMLITVCSLRKDHLGAYGHEGGLSPAVDELAQQSVVFDAAFSASNFTLASLTAVLTGRFGSSTGVTGWDKGLTQDVPTLPEVLGFYGYQTAGFTTDAPSGFRPDYGLDRGFQHLEIIEPPRRSPDGRFREGELEAPGAPVVPLRRWLEEEAGEKPRFVMLHTRTAHFPFVLNPPEAGSDPTGMRQLLWEAGQQEAKVRDPTDMPGMAGGTKQEGIVEIISQDPLAVRVGEVGEPAVDVWKEAYGEAVAEMDADLAAVMSALQDSGRMDRTIVVLVADHGESLNDHGELLHGDAFFDGVINVPMLISVPGLKPAKNRLGALTSHVDLLPTILELVGAVIPAGIDGQSLVDVLKGTKQEIRGVALSEGGVARHGSSDLPGAVIAGPWQLLVQRRGCPDETPGHQQPRDGVMPLCLFNRDTDALQQHNVAKQHPEVVQALLQRWNGFRKSRTEQGQAVDLSPAFVEALQKTGYDFSTGAP